MMEDNANRLCLFCGKTLLGRRDKKFCDSTCKSDYHNQNRSIGEIYISRIQSVQRHNRKILKTLCPQGKATVRKSILDQMGYDFRHFTGMFKSEKLLYYLVYDYAFAPIVDEKSIKKALIVSRQPYMDKLGFEIWRK